MPDVEVAAGQEPQALGLDLEVCLEDGGRRCVLRSASVSDGNRQPASADLRAALEARGIVAGLDADVVERVVKALRTGARFRGQAIIAKHLAPKPPSREFRVEWLVAPGSLVLPDTSLCRFVPRVPGRDGYLVTGELVEAAEPAPPKAIDGVPVEVGAGVARGGHGLDLCSTAFGWLVVDCLDVSVAPALKRDEGSEEFRGYIVRVAGDGRCVEAAHVRAALEAVSDGAEVLDEQVQQILEDAREAPPAVDVDGGGAEIRRGSEQVSSGVAGAVAGERKAPGSKPGRDGGVAAIPVHVVEGDVDCALGNISCDGAVKILGMVRPRLEVRAYGDVEVHGLIDAARVWSGGDVVAQAGVRGAGRTELRVAGSLTTKFIEKAVVEVQGDLVVESHIFQSSVLCDGKVMVQGSIAGGRVQALGGIVAGTLGSQEKVATVLAPGTGFHCTREMERLERELKQLQAKRSKLIGALRRLTGSRGLAFIAVLPPARRQVALRLAQTLKRLELELRELGEALHDLRLGTQDRASPCVDVRSEVHAGVLVMIGDRVRSVVSSVSRPCRFRLDDLGEIVLS